MKLGWPRWLAAAAAFFSTVACGGSGDGSDVTFDAAGITVHTADPTQPLDHRLFGLNVPAWANPDRLADPMFRQVTVDSGATVLRMPGGSWSNSYQWLACERQDASGCYFVGTARPSDFAAFLQATGLEGMWTVSFNGTAQEAAALVAFFNGTVGDERVIGTDRAGVDWGTVGEWAQLRADAGLPDPVRVAMWEVGNEIFGAVDDAEGSCASFGWEEVWTCDGESYVNGDDAHDGFVDFATAMRAVDPTISIGAVGVADPDSWSGFGSAVISAAAGEFDFYVVHDYGFDASAPVDQVLSRPVREWPGMAAEATEALRAADPDEEIPIAVTEYNLISFQEGDDEGLMDEAVNALYVADMIGQMARSGVPIANLWNLVNGEADNGTDYGIVDADTGALNPPYFALSIWAQAGDELVPVTSTLDEAEQVSVYATRTETGQLRLIALNKTGTQLDAPITVDTSTARYTWTATAATAATLEDEQMEAGVAVAVSTTEPAAAATVALPPYSITLVTLTPA